MDFLRSRGFLMIALALVLLVIAAAFLIVLHFAASRASYEAIHF